MLTDLNFTNAVYPIYAHTKTHIRTSELLVAMYKYSCGACSISTHSFSSVFIRIDNVIQLTK